MRHPAPPRTTFLADSAGLGGIGLADLDPAGVVFAVTSTASASTVASLCTQLWEQGTPTLLLRAGCQAGWPSHPVSSVVDIEDSDTWEIVMGILRSSIGPGNPLRRLVERSGTRMQLWRGDGRPGALLRQLGALGGAVLVAPPASEAARWPNDGEGVWVAPAVAGSLAWVLSFSASALPDPRVTHPCRAEWLPADPRPFHGSVAPPSSIPEMSLALARAHLVHDRWHLTLGAVISAELDGAARAELAHRTLGLLGDDAPSADPAHMTLRAMAQSLEDSVYSLSSPGIE